MAVSFLTATKRLATVLRNEDIFSLRSPLEPAGTAAFTGATTFGAAAGCAFKASSFVMRPPTPLPEVLSKPFSAKIFAAAGDGTPSA